MSDTTDSEQPAEGLTERKGKSLSSATSDAIKNEMNAVLSDLENLDLSDNEQASAEANDPEDDDAALMQEFGLQEGAEDDDIIAEIGFDMDESSEVDTRPGSDSSSSEDDDELALLREFGVNSVTESGAEDEVVAESAEREIAANRLDSAERTITDLRRQLHRITSDNAQRTKSLERMRDDVQDRLQRTVAEFANYRRRADREKEEAVLFGNEKLLKSILPVIDNLQIALTHADHSDSDDFVSGVQMVHNLMLQSLERQGVAAFDSEGELFDPERHEAVSRIENDELPENTVIEELQKGYFLNERLLRPAKVTVSCTLAVMNQESSAGGTVESSEDQESTELEESGASEDLADSDGLDGEAEELDAGVPEEDGNDELDSAEPEESDGESATAQSDESAAQSTEESEEDSLKEVDFSDDEPESDNQIDEDTAGSEEEESS